LTAFCWPAPGIPTSTLEAARVRLSLPTGDNNARHRVGIGGATLHGLIRPPDQRARPRKTQLRVNARPLRWVCRRGRAAAPSLSAGSPPAHPPYGALATDAAASCGGRADPPQSRWPNHARARPSQASVPCSPPCAFVGRGGAELRRRLPPSPRLRRRRRRPPTAFATAPRRPPSRARLLSHPPHPPTSADAGRRRDAVRARKRSEGGREARDGIGAMAARRGGVRFRLEGKNANSGRKTADVSIENGRTAAEQRQNSVFGQWRKCGRNAAETRQKRGRTTTAPANDFHFGRGSRSTQYIGHVH